MTSTGSEPKAKVGPADLDRLLDRLPDAIGPIAVDTALRLHAVFAAAGRLTRAQCVGMALAVVARQRDDIDRARPLVERWVEAVVDEGPSDATEGPRPDGEGAGAAPAPMVDAGDRAARRLRLRVVVAGVAAVVIGAALLAPDPSKPPAPTALDVAPADAALLVDAAAPPDAAVVADPVDEGVPPPDARIAHAHPTRAVERDALTFARTLEDAAVGEVPRPARPLRPLEAFEMPRVRTFRRPPHQKAAWQDAITALLGLLALVFLLWSRRRWIEEDAPYPPAEGRPPGPPPRTPRAVHHLVPPDDEAQLVWGIDRYASEDPGRRLDLRASIRQTVSRGGLPVVVRRRRRLHRAVWLWIDEEAAARHPEMERMADGIQRSLRRANLPIEVAHFHGDPSTLVDDEGTALSPIALDELRDGARVAILTDGQLLVDRLGHRLTRPQVERDLRLLGLWPAVKVFDFGADRHRLAARLDPHGIEVGRPDTLLAWLGGSVYRPPGSHRNDFAVWAAACALSPMPVDLDTALALRHQLDLEVEPARIRALIDEVAARGERLWWPSPQRERRLSWLTGALPPWRLDDIRRFWVAYYRAAADAEVSHGRSPHWHALSACVPLVGLWDHQHAAVGSAVEALLHYRESAPSQVAQLARCAPWDGDFEGRARLPWRFEDLDPVTRARLRLLGLGGLVHARRERLARPGRIWAGIGAAVAATVLGGVWLATDPVIVSDDAPPGFVSAHGPRPVDAVESSTRVGRRRWWYDFGETPGSLGAQSLDTKAGFVARAIWGETMSVSCRSRSLGREMWLCGTTEVAAIPRDGWPTVSVALLMSSDAAAPARRLAIALLDSGTADRVIFDQSRPLRAQKLELFYDVSRLIRAVERFGGQLLVFSAEPLQIEPSPTVTLIASSDWPALASRLGGLSPRAAKDVWPEADVRGPGLLLARGCQSGERAIVGDVAFRCVAAGDHLLPRPGGLGWVSLAEYWISEVEITHETHARGSGQLEHTWSDRHQPMTTVPWNLAQRTCESLGGRLPLTDEWEVACRAPSSHSIWGWAYLTDGLVQPDAQTHRGWFFGLPDARPWQVGLTPPNAWGLRDMLGNVAEWTSDVAYRRFDSVRPRDEQRVMGGSIADSAGSVDCSTSSRRARWLPSDHIGFRCVIDQ